MEEKSKGVPFPQANDFDKVVRILNIEQEEKLGDKQYISVQLDMLSDRQVQYYISACTYLGLINSNKKFTQIANEIRLLNSSEQTVELARLIVSDKVFGKAYFMQKLLKVKLSTEDVVELMKENGVLFDSEAMYLRRAQTVTSWLAWIDNVFE